MIIIPIEISARHVHISREDLEALFGAGYELTALKKISQTGQYAARETVTLKNGANEMAGVRIVGPTRSETQVELSASDARKLGVRPPVKRSGSVAEAAILTIIGPHGSLTKRCAIIPQRHIHASLEDAKRHNLQDGQIVSVKCGQDRGVIFSQVIVRVAQDFVWNFHIDVDEANAAGLLDNESGVIIS